MIQREVPLAAAAPSPLQEVANRLSGLAEYLTYGVGIPDEPGWLRLVDLADGGRLAEWHAQLTARHGDRRAASADLGGSIGYAAVAAWMLPTLAESRLPTTDIDGVAVHRHDEGWIDAVDVEELSVFVLPDDTAAGSPGTVVVPHREELLDLLVDRMVQVDPLFDGLRGVCRIGAAALWGGLADSVGSWALWLARTLDRDRNAAWRDAEAIIDRLAAHRPQLRNRPHLFPVAYRGGDELFQVRGTCCLWYRTVEDPDPDGDGYCNTCPLRTDGSRTRRIRAYLEDQAGGQDE